MCGKCIAMNFCNFDRSCGKTLTRFDSSSWKKSATGSSSVTTNLLIYSFESYCFRKLSFEYVSNSLRRFSCYFQSFHDLPPEVLANLPEVVPKSNIPHIAVQYYIFCSVKLYQFCSCKSFALLHKVLLRWTFQDFSFFSIFRPCVRLWLYLYGSKTSQFR